MWMLQSIAEFLKNQFRTVNISVGHVKSKKRATSYLNIGYHEGYQLAMSLSANCVRTAPYSESKIFVGELCGNASRKDCCSWK